MKARTRLKRQASVLAPGAKATFCSGLVRMFWRNGTGTSASPERTSATAPGRMRRARSRCGAVVAFSFPPLPRRVSFPP